MGGRPFEISAVLSFARFLSLSLLVVVQPINAFAQIPDEVFFQKFVERFFFAYASEDLNALVSLWSTNSPKRQEFFEELSEIFSIDDFSFANLRLLRFQSDGEKVILRVAADSSVKRFHLPAPISQQIIRTFILVKENGEWRVWDYYPSAEDLAKALVSADETEIEPLLETEPELVTEELISVLNELSLKSIQQGEPQKGLRIAQLAQKIAARIDDPAGYALAGYYEAHAFRFVGELERAIERLEETVAWLQKEVEEREGTLAQSKFLRLQLTLFRLLHWAGLFYEGIAHNPHEALRKFQAMLDYARRYRDTYIEAHALNCLGGRHVSMGKVAQGIQEMEQAVKLFEQLLQRFPENKNVAESLLVTLNHLASAYNSLLISQRAFALYKRSLNLSRQLGNKMGEMGALWGLGVSSDRSGELKKAQEYFEQSLKLAREEEHYGWVYTVLGSLVGLHLRQGNIDEALACAEESLKVARHIRYFLWELGSLENLAFLLVQKGNLQKAKAVIDEGLKLAERLNAPAFTLHHALGDFHRKQKQWRLAAEAYQKAFENWEKGNVQQPEPTGRLFEPNKEWASISCKLATCLSALGQTEEALQVAERAKARTLTEVLQTGKINLNKHMTEEELRQEKELREQLYQLGVALRSLQGQPNPDQQKLKTLLEKVAEARCAYESFRRELYLKHPELAAYRVELPTLSASQLKPLLPNDQVAFLEFLLGDEQSFLFLITQQNGQVKISVHPLKVSRDEVTKLVRSFREKLVNRAMRLPEATALYDLLIAPVEKNLVRKTVLGIIPDGVLWELPFAALKDKSGKYLVERFAIFYAPSLTTLNAMQNYAQQRPKLSKGQLLAFAYPSFGATRKVELPLRGTFEELPQTEKEARAIAAVFGKNAQIFLRSQATEERLKNEAPRYRILHIATHGIYDAFTPLYSGLLLAQSGGDDGILEAWEIADMDLNAELVVLSACNTARGVVREGEGLIGFAWAIFVAGCPSSLLSQWQVADESTAELMMAFYRNWRSQPSKPQSTATKAEALQRAQLTLLQSKKWSHPFFWAPFILIGEWR